MRSRSCRPMAVVATAMSALAGCGSGGTGTVAVIAQAASWTVAADTAHVAVRLNFGGIQEAATGEVDFQTRAMHLTSADGEQIIIIGDDTYDLRPRSTTWSHQHHPTDVLQALETGVDPAPLLSLLRELSPAVRTVGHEMVDGVNATHFHADVNLGAAELVAGASTTRIPNPRFPTFPVDVWIGQGRVLRLTWSSPDGNAGLSGPYPPAQPFATEDFSDFGIPVSIAAPPTSTVAPA